MSGADAIRFSARRVIPHEQANVPKKIHVVCIQSSKTSESSKGKREFMVRISTAVVRSLTCYFTQFAFVIALAWLANACHRPSAESHVIALSAHQSKQMLAAEIRRLRQHVKPSPANNTPKSENSVGRLLRGISGTNTMFVTERAEKNIELAKLNFLLAT